MCFIITSDSSFRFASYLNPQIPIFLHCKHFPSYLINLSYVNDVGVGVQLNFSLSVIKGPILPETSDLGAHRIRFFIWLKNKVNIKSQIMVNTSRVVLLEPGHTDF